MARKPRTKRGKRRKVHTVMSHFKSGKLHSGKSGRIVRKHSQAVAIALNMAGLSRKGRKRGKR